jgi:uncharacterized protein
VTPDRLVYLHGFASGPGSAKATFLARQFRQQGYDLEVPDLAGGDFSHLTLTRQLSLLERLLEGEPAILLGSSLGGYLAALYAARHPEIVKVVMLAPAFNFYRRWREMMGEAAVQEWEETGYRNFFHYATGREEPLHMDFLRDAAQYEGYPVLEQPAIILHGLNDEVAPVNLAYEFHRRAADCRLLILESDHGLLDRTHEIWSNIREFLALGA